MSTQDVKAYQLLITTTQLAAIMLVQRAIAARQEGNHRTQAVPDDPLVEVPLQRSRSDESITLHTSTSRKGKLNSSKQLPRLRLLLLEAHQNKRIAHLCPAGVTHPRHSFQWQLQAQIVVLQRPYQSSYKYNNPCKSILTIIMHRLSKTSSLLPIIKNINLIQQLQLATIKNV